MYSLRPSLVKKMKIGFRILSLKKRLAAGISLKRVIRHNLGVKAPRGLGWITNPRKALNNRIYCRTTRGCALSLNFFLLMSAMVLLMLFYAKHKIQ
jgi:hypothetical protein